MSYIEANLLSDETMLYRTYPHWTVFSLPFLLFASAIFCFIYHIHLHEVGYLLFAFAVITSYFALVTFICSEFAVTNHRVIAKRGFIQRQTIGVVLNKVESVDVEQDILGRMLHYGTVIVKGTGGTSDIFYKVGEPFLFRNAVQEAVNTERHS